MLLNKRLNFECGVDFTMIAIDHKWHFHNEVKILAKSGMSSQRGQKLLFAVRSNSRSEDSCAPEITRQDLPAVAEPVGVGG
jgi:hypothetical protein